MNNNYGNSRIITLIDKKGNLRKFQVVDEVNIDGNIYIVALPYEQGFIEEKIVFIQKNDESLEIVEDEEIKSKINEFLTNITVNGEIEYLTFINDSGEEVEYEIIDDVEIYDKKYLVAIEKDAPDDSEDYKVFEMDGKNITIIEDPELIEEIIESLSENEFYDLDDSQISLKDGNHILDFNIIGKVEIYGKHYLISTSYDQESEELVPILLENNKIVSYIKNHLISDDTKYFISKVQDYINKNQHKSHFFEDN